MTPQGLCSIGENAFELTPLDSIALPEGITEIGEYTFHACRDLKHVELPASLRRIGRFVFALSGLERITIPEGVTEIGDHCFGGCRSLRAVLVSQKTAIDPTAFDYCPGVHIVYTD